MGNYSILSKADRDELRENGIDPERLVIAHRNEVTTCYLNHKTRDNILLGGHTVLEDDDKRVRAKRKTKEILRRNGIDLDAVDVVLEGERAISMVHKDTRRSIYLARGDRRW